MLVWLLRAWCVYLALGCVSVCVSGKDEYQTRGENVLMNRPSVLLILNLLEKIL